MKKVGRKRSDKKEVLFIRVDSDLVEKIYAYRDEQGLDTISGACRKILRDHFKPACTT